MGTPYGYRHGDMATYNGRRTTGCCDVATGTRRRADNWDIFCGLITAKAHLHIYKLETGTWAVGVHQQQHTKSK